MIKIHNSATGEVIEREMNAEELAQMAIDAEAFEQRKAQAKSVAEAKAAAEAKLAALGLTSEDLKAIGL
jgi:hypothetical protein